MLDKTWIQAFAFKTTFSPWKIQSVGLAGSEPYCQPDFVHSQFFCGKIWCSSLQGVPSGLLIIGFFYGDTVNQEVCVCCFCCCSWYFCRSVLCTEAALACIGETISNHEEEQNAVWELLTETEEERDRWLEHLERVSKLQPVTEDAAMSFGRRVAICFPLKLLFNCQVEQFVPLFSRRALKECTCCGEQLPQLANTHCPICYLFWSIPFPASFSHHHFFVDVFKLPFSSRPCMTNTPKSQTTVMLW